MKKAFVSKDKDKIDELIKQNDMNERFRISVYRNEKGDACCTFVNLEKDDKSEEYNIIALTTQLSKMIAEEDGDVSEMFWKLGRLVKSVQENKGYGWSEINDE